VPIKLFYKLVSRIFVTLVPLLLITFSIIHNLPNADLHKRTLANGDFYNQFSTELQGNDLESSDLKKGFSQIVLTAVIGDLASPGWLKALFEDNIDLLTKWLVTPDTDLILDLPTKDIENSIANNIDETTSEVVENFDADIPECSDDLTEKIKREGFDLSKELCLPASVKNGEQTLTDFLEVTEEDEQLSRALDKIIRNNVLNSFSETVSAEEALDFNKNSDAFLQNLNWFRDWFLRIQSWLPIGFLIALMLLASDMFLSFLAGRKFTKEIRRLFFFTSTGVLSTALVVVMGLGGMIYLNSFLSRLFIPGLASDNITNLLAVEGIRFGFNLVSTAVWASVGMLSVNIIWIVLERAGVLSSLDKRNERLQNFAPAGGEKIKNTTFDATFQQTVKNSSVNGVNPVTQNVQTINPTPKPEVTPITPTQVPSSQVTSQQTTNNTVSDNPFSDSLQRTVQSPTSNTTTQTQSQQNTPAQNPTNSNIINPNPAPPQFNNPKPTTINNNSINPVQTQPHPQDNQAESEFPSLN